MSTVVGTRRAPATVVILTSATVLAAAVVTGQAKSLAPVVLAVAIFAAWSRSLLRWDSLIGFILAVVLFVPVGAYRMSASLPFNLELYRIVVALVALAWISSLLVDSRVAFQRTSFDKPILSIITCILISEIANEGRVGAYGSHVVKTLTFFLSFVVVYYIITTTVKRRSSVEFLIKFLVAGGAFIGASTIDERRSGFNIFNHLHTVLPFLTFQGSYQQLIRDGNLRVYGSAQQPIALGAALTLFVPLSIYLVRTSGKRWIVATLLLVLGAFASGSRTVITMAIAGAFVYLLLKPRQTIRLWPLLIPTLLAIHVFLPGELGTLKASFFPKGGIIKEQSYLGSDYNAQLSGGRVRQAVPMLREASHHFVFGEGYGTRISGFDEPDRNAPILDNQWLNIALDTGYLGLLLWVWLIFGSARRLMRASRRASTEDGDDWLLAGLAASLAAFGIGMLTFDAFGFTQCFFLFWILLALSAVVLRLLQLSDPGKRVALGPVGWPIAGRVLRGRESFGQTIDED